MKILIISPYYKPGFKAGGPVQSMYNLCNLLSKELQINILTQNFDFGSTEEYDLPSNKWIDFENYKIKYCQIENFNLKQIEKSIQDINPNYIYFNSLFSTLTIRFIIKNFLNKVSPKIIIAPRGELDPGALLIKGVKKKIFLRAVKFIFDKETIFHATTEREKYNIAKYFKNKSIVAENIPKFIEVKPQKVVKQSNKTNIVFVSRISPKKNLLYAVKLLNQIKVEGEINFDIIGPIEDQTYWHKVLSISELLPANIKINYVGEVKNDDLIFVTKKYHYFLFPTLAENYGHIIYECLSYGIPVIVSDQTPWIENDNGIFVRRLQDPESFKALILKLHSYGQDEYSETSTKAFEYAKTFVNTDKLLLNYKNLFSGNQK